MRTPRSAPTHPGAPQTLARDVHARAPTTRWVTASPSIATAAGWWSLAVVRDVGARRVVGWAMPPTVDRRVVLDARTHAGQRRQGHPGLRQQRDRGSHSTRGDEQDALARAQRDGRMRRTGNGWDHALMERVFATVQADRRLTVVPRHAAARTASCDDRERWYHPYRRHARVADQSPATVARQ